jgi:hypothetical protein
MLPDDESFFAMCGSEVWDDSEDVVEPEMFNTQVVDITPPSILEEFIQTIKSWFARV